MQHTTLQPCQLIGIKRYITYTSSMPMLTEETWWIGDMTLSDWDNDHGNAPTTTPQAGGQVLTIHSIQ